VKSIRIPPIAINLQHKVISLDWRRLCQEFYSDERRLRRALYPRTRTAALNALGHQLSEDEVQGQRWL
jgi:hypothetical protein